MPCKTSCISLLLLMFAALLSAPQSLLAENNTASVDTSAAGNSDVAFSHSPGEYGRDISLHLASSKTAAEKEGTVIEYRFLESESSDFVEYSLPLHLTALPGEKRVFNLDVRVKTDPDRIENSTEDNSPDDNTKTVITRVKYTIDKRPPPAPKIEGTYEKGNLQFTVRPAETDKDIRTYYWNSLDTLPFRMLSKNNGNTSLPWSEEILSAEIAAYSMDTLGNYSPIEEKKVIRREYGSSAFSSLTILSPTKGTYENPQKLVLEPLESFEWIRYTLDGRDPAKTGGRYEEPVHLDVNGDFTLKIAGKRRSTGEIERIEESFTVLAESPDIKLSLPEQLQSDSPTFDPPEIDNDRKGEYRFFYTHEDRDVTKEDTEFTKSLKMDLSAPSLHLMTIRIGALNTATGKMHQYRYFYRRDNRIPAAPPIYITGRTPFRDSTQVVIPIEGNTEVFYTLDGSTPDRFSRKYEGPFELTSPKDADAGSITLRAAARSVEGKMSALSSESFVYNNRRPEKPEILVDNADEGSMEITVSSSSEIERVRYEIAYNRKNPENMEVDTDSPVGSESMTIEFPHGFSGTAVLIAAAEDAAGNISLSSDPVTFTTDTVPPRPPVIDSDKAEAVTINGREEKGERIMYAVVSSEDLSQLEDTRPREDEFSEYTEPIDLTADAVLKDSGGRFFRVFAYALNKENNSRNDGIEKSSTVSTSVLEIDRREAEPAVFSGISAGDSYSRPFMLYLQSPQAGGEIRYEVYEHELQPGERKGRVIKNHRDEESLPDAQSPLADGPILFTGDEDKKIVYTIKARTHLPSADSWSEVSSLSFTLDRKAPLLPELEVPKNGELYNLPVTVHPPELEYEDERMWVYWSTEEELSELLKDKPVAAEDIRTLGVPLSTPLQIGPDKNREKEYLLYTAIFDAAGNSTVSEKPLRFIVDRVPPKLPEIEGAPEGGTSAGPVTLELAEDTGKNGEPVKLLYEYKKGYGEVDTPHRGSPELELPLTIEGEEEKISRFRLLYRSIDRAGNISKETGELAFSVDNRLPAPPEIRIRKKKHNLYTLSLSSGGDNIELRYGVESSPDTVYSGPVQLDVSAYPLDLESVKIHAQSLNENGIQSETISREVEIEETPSAFVSGISDGSIYNDDITVEPMGDLRYELVANTARETLQEKPRVSMLSPRMEDPLNLTASEGQTVHYTLSVGKIDSHGGGYIGGEAFTVTIDKTPPPPPEIRAEGDQNYFTKASEVRLSGEDGGEVYFRVEINGDGPDAFRTAPHVYSLDTDPGEKDTYRIEAYTQDSAGNRSTVAERSFIVDRAGIYVSDSGRDSFSGSRDKPFKSLDRALYEAETGERNTVFLPPGNYTVSKPIEVEKANLTLRGGYLRDTGKTADKETRISAGENYPDNSPLINIKNASLSIEGVSLSNSSLDAPLIVQRGENSSLDILDSRLTHPAWSIPTLIDIDGGVFEIRASEIELGALRSGEIIKIDNASFLVDNSRIYGGEAEESLKTISLKNSEGVIKNSIIDPEGARDIYALHGEDSDIEIDSSEISTGRGFVRAYGLSTSGGAVVLKDTKINGDRDSRLTFGISSKEGDVSLENSTISVHGSFGSVALSIRGGTAEILDTELHKGISSDFSYLLRADSASLVIKDALLSSRESSDSVGIELKKSEADIFSSTLALFTGEGEAKGILLEDDSSLKLDDSVIAFPRGKGVDPSNAGVSIGVYENSSTNSRLENTTFAGADVILHTAAGERRTTVEELEKARPPYDQKNPHSGNSETGVEGFFADPEAGDFTPAP
ncbi:MAG: FN3 associated domain-containing protein [Spirochaetaceae bacterium]